MCYVCVCQEISYHFETRIALHVSLNIKETTVQSLPSAPRTEIRTERGETSYIKEYFNKILSLLQLSTVHQTLKKHYRIIKSLDKKARSTWKENDEIFLVNSPPGIRNTHQISLDNTRTYPYF